MSSKRVDVFCCLPEKKRLLNKQSIDGNLRRHDVYMTSLQCQVPVQIRDSNLVPSCAPFINSDNKDTHRIIEPCKYHPLETCNSDEIAVWMCLPWEAAAKLGCPKLEFRAPVGALWIKTVPHYSRCTCMASWWSYSWKSIAHCHAISNQITAVARMALNEVHKLTSCVWYSCFQSI